MGQMEFGTDLEKDVKCKDERVEERVSPSEETLTAQKEETHQTIIRGSV